MKTVKNHIMNYEEYIKKITTYNKFSLKKWLKEIIKTFNLKDKSLLEGLNYDIGKYSEEQVKKYLIKKGYDTCLSPGSKTLSDVWGLKKKKDYFHLILIQVKGSSVGHPKDITKNDNLKSEFKRMTQIIKTKFTELPFYNKSVCGLILSYGYIGLEVGLNRNTPKNHSIFKAKMISFLKKDMENIDRNTMDEIKDYISSIHNSMK